MTPLEGREPWPEGPKGDDVKQRWGNVDWYTIDNRPKDDDTEETDPGVPTSDRSRQWFWGAWLMMGIIGGACGAVIGVALGGWGAAVGCSIAGVFVSMCFNIDAALAASEAMKPKQENER